MWYYVLGVQVPWGSLSLHQFPIRNLDRDWIQENNRKLWFSRFKWVAKMPHALPSKRIVGRDTQTHNRIQYILSTTQPTTTTTTTSTSTSTSTSTRRDQQHDEACSACSCSTLVIQQWTASIVSLTRRHGTHSPRFERLFLRRDEVHREWRLTVLKRTGVLRTVQETYSTLDVSFPQLWEGCTGTDNARGKGYTLHRFVDLTLLSVNVICCYPRCSAKCVLSTKETCRSIL